MPPPFKVELVPYNPRWTEDANLEGKRLSLCIGSSLLMVHHVGSTSIPGIRAKPIIDLIPVVTDLSALDVCKDEIEALGYEWWGEFGLPGRRYCTKDDPNNGYRIFQLHCFIKGSLEINRHLAFRDYLRERREIAIAYDQEKARCQKFYPDNSHDYGDCKSAWVSKVELEAVAHYHTTERR